MLDHDRDATARSGALDGLPASAENELAAALAVPAPPATALAGAARRASARLAGAPVGPVPAGEAPQ